MERPLPSEALREPGFQIEPSPELAAWLKDTFVVEGAALENPDHCHLSKVDLVCMFTNVEYIDGGMPIVGMAEIMNVNGKPWAKAEKTDHLCLMHGNVPQARIWIYAPYWAACSDASACATGEHEMYHYAHKRSREGDLLFDDFDRPVLTKRAHDVEEFVGVMERYGVDACAGKSREFVEAAKREPLIAADKIAAACCACGARL